MNKYQMFNNVLLRHVLQYIDTEKKEDNHIPDIAHKIRLQAFYFKAINNFTDEEIKQLMEIGEEEEFIWIKNKEISLIVMALELMKLWVDIVPKENRPVFNISDKKLTMGKNHYILGLIDLKHREPELYKEKKEIVESTAAHAKVWFSYMTDKLVKD